MRKLVVLCVLAMVLGLTAAPAFAQRDPFNEGGDSGNSAPQEPRESGQNGAADPAPAPAPAQGSEVLPLTGPEPAPWLAVAYVLVAIGAGSLALVRLYRPGAIR